MKIKVLFILSLIFVIASPVAFGDVADKNVESKEAEVESEVVEAESALELQSPRATIETFLHTMNDFKRGSRKDIDPAIQALNLSKINLIVRQEEGRDFAWTLLEVLDRTRIIDPEKIPSNPETTSPYIFEKYDEGTIELVRQTDNRWLFSSSTIEALPVILDELTKQGRERIKVDPSGTSHAPLHIRLRTQLPESLRSKTLLIENWQWLAAALFVMIGVIGDKLTSLLLKGTVIRWNSSRFWKSYEDLSPDILRPFGLMVMAGVWWYGINQIGLDTNYRIILLVAAKFVASISAIWGAYRLVDMIGAFLSYRATQTANKLDDALIPLFTRTLKIIITLAGLLFLASVLSVDITGLVAGLGLGGLAFALASKDLVQNLFGSVTVLSDNAFMVGDWIVVGKVEGTVEEIGFRSTRVRTFYNSVVTIPNSRFITADVDNMGKRVYRRYKTNVPLTYDTTPEQIEAFCQAARELVRLTPEMRKDYFHIYLNEMNESSIDVLIYVFFEVPDWAKELEARHHFIVDLLALAKSLEIDIAFPTQTLLVEENASKEQPINSGSEISLGETSSSQQIAACIFASNPGRA